MKVILCIAFVAIAAVQAVDKRQNVPNVAFSAGLTHNVDLASNATVAYDKVWIDTNNAYNNNTGVFTVPTHGMYTFIYHGLSETTGQLWLDLYKNSDYQVTAYAHGNNDYASASNAITLECNVGDQIYIQGHGSNVLYGVSDEIYCSFSGFLNTPIHGGQ